MGLGLRTHLKSAEAEEDVRKKADEAVRGVGGKIDEDEEWQGEGQTHQCDCQTHPGKCYTRPGKCPTHPHEC